MTKMAMIVYLSYDETSPDFIDEDARGVEDSITEILDNHGYSVNEVKQVSTCCECPVVDNQCENCGNAQNLSS